MRFPSLSACIRTLHAFSTTTRASFTPLYRRTISPAPQNASALRPMPTIPFLGALFGSSAKMANSENFPVQKTEGEWQAILSPGTFPLSMAYSFEPPYQNAHILIPCQLQNNSVFSAKKAQSRHHRESTTSTIPQPAFIPAPDAPHPSTKQIINSTRVAAGRRSGTRSRARWASAMTAVLE